MRTVKVLFKDDTTIEIEKVIDFVIDNNYDMFFIQRKNHKVMIPRDIVKMIGFIEDFPRELGVM